MQLRPVHAAPGRCTRQVYASHQGCADLGLILIFELLANKLSPGYFPAKVVPEYEYPGTYQQTNHDVHCNPPDAVVLQVCCELATVKLYWNRVVPER